LVSHNCRVLHDICTICGHKSATRSDYCKHQKEQAGQILDDGRRVGVLNPHPKFFDISIVVIGADRTSFVMAKVAYLGTPQELRFGADRAFELGLTDPVDDAKQLLKVAMSRKLADIVKQVPAMAAKTLPRLVAAEKPLPRHVLDMLGRHPLGHALTATTAAGIVLRPQEFQRLALTAARRPDLADQLERMGGVFAPGHACDTSVQFGAPSQYAPDLGRLLAALIGGRSMFEQPLARRIATVRISIEVCPDCGSPPRGTALKGDPLLEKVAAAYNGYRQQLLEKIEGVANNITRRDVALLSAIGGNSLEESIWHSPMSKSAAASLPQMALLGAVPLAYLYGAYVGERGAEGEKVPESDSFIAKHPVLAASVFVGLARLGMRLHQTGRLDDLVSTVGRKLSGYEA
jgi:hypothetical protein